jgi:hypothetical protein
MPRAVHYANVSETTIKQIRKEHKQRQESDPNKKCLLQERSVGPDLNIQLCSWTILMFYKKNYL